MNKYILVLFTLVLPVLGVNAQHLPAAKSDKSSPAQGNKGYQVNWTRDPFDHKLFIENKGQFDSDIIAYTDSKILYQVRFGGVKACFTANGIIYRYTDLSLLSKERNSDHDGDMATPPSHFLSLQWAGSSPGVTVNAGEEQGYYYTYSIGSATVKANIFKKITYHNIYPGIDIEYVFPKDNRQGLKYSVIVHPGADLSKVKLVYGSNNGMQLNANGEVKVASDIGEITDHAPVSFYEGGESVNATYTLNGNEESFKITGAYDNTQTLIIDPWTTNPNFTGSGFANLAYDVDYDQYGNVYAAGSNNPFQLTKFNTAGVQQWTYNIPFGPVQRYGDFCVDKVTGTCYCVQGYSGGGTEMVKVNTNATLLASYPINFNMNEMWRVIYNPCTRQIVIGGGSTNSNYCQAAMLDTTLATMNPVNPLGTTLCCRDDILMALDPVTSTAYMAFGNTNGPESLMSVPIPALNPANYIVPDAYLFGESTPMYYAASNYWMSTGGMNGMAASPNWLYMYDGEILTKVNKATGAAVSSLAITGKPYTCSGLDADACDNVYAGVNTSVQIYNSSLSLLSTIPLTDTVYDVVLANNYNTMYACGRGYVSSINMTALPPSITVTNTITNASCGSCNGKATPTVLLCGGPPTAAITYLWSNGQTTQTATGLCAGTYTVTVKLGCTDSVKDTVVVKVSGTSGPLTVTPTQTNVKCNGGTTGTAGITPTTGTGPYSYTWSNGATISTVNSLSAGTYSVVVSDSTCLIDTSFFTITQPTALTIKAVAFATSCSACNGQVNVIPSGGTSPYTYYWNNGNTNASQSGMCAGTDSIYVTDGNGCMHDTVVTVAQPAGLRDSIVTTVNVLCNGGNTGSSTVGVKGGTGPYTYSWNTSPLQTNVTATTLTAGNYTVTVTDKAGCKDSAITTISQPSLLTATLSPPSTICVGQSVTITAATAGGSSPYTYLWNTGATTSSITVSPASTTSYTITVTDANGCTAGPVSVTITVNPALAVTTLPGKSACAGASVTLSATATGGDGTYTYMWNPGAQTGASITVSPGVTTTYTVTVTDGCGSPAASATETVTINPLPTVSFKADTTNGCYPVCVNFKDLTTANPDKISGWKWTFGDGGTSTSQNPSYCYTAPGSYTIGLIATSDSGCTSSQTIVNMITVYDHPHADFSSSPQPTNLLNPSITFTDLSTDAYGIITWFWKFGDLLDGTSMLENPVYKYTDTGTFCPTLKVTNKYGCVDSIQKCLIIDPFFTLYIPNAFTPDENGINDFFTAKGVGIRTFEMWVFDRWGMQLFYSDNIYAGWDGKVQKGASHQIVQEDTYVYIIQVTDIFNKQHKYLGKVSVIK
jgi:gliding motility-associated-like protein